MQAPQPRAQDLSIGPRPGLGIVLFVHLSWLMNGDILMLETTFKARTNRSPRRGPSQPCFTAKELGVTPEFDRTQQYHFVYLSLALRT